LREDDEDEHENEPVAPLCKPSPSLPCLIGDDDEEMATNQKHTTTKTPTTPAQKSKDQDRLSLSRMREKKMIIYVCV